MEITQNALPFGLHEKTSEGLSAKKSSYAPPAIKIVEFMIDRGFEASVPDGAGQWIVSDANMLQETGSRTNQWRTAEDGWF